MSFGDIALGTASLILGLHQLNRGVQELGSGGVSRKRRRRASPTRGARGFAGVPSNQDVREASRLFGFGVFSDRKSLKSGFSGLGRTVKIHDSGRKQTVAGPLRMRSFKIRSLEDRIHHLRDQVDKGKRDPVVYAFVREATSKKCGSTWCIPEKNNVEEARAVYDAIRKNVRYISDIHGVDTYQHPARTLRLGSADCDDYSTLICSAMLSMGIPCRFKVLRMKGDKDWGHIYAQAGFPRKRPTKWMSMDASVPVPFGWEAPRRMVEASRVFPVR